MTTSDETMKAWQDAQAKIDAKNIAITGALKIIEFMRRDLKVVEIDSIVEIVKATFGMSAEARADTVKYVLGLRDGLDLVQTFMETVSLELTATLV
jgi:hypothetical protein